MDLVIGKLAMIVFMVSTGGVITSVEANCITKSICCSFCTVQEFGITQQSCTLCRMVQVGFANDIGNFLDSMHLASAGLLSSMNLASAALGSVHFASAVQLLCGPCDD